MVLPVVKALHQRGIKVQLIALTTAARSARQAGLAPWGYADFLHLVDREVVLSHGRLLAVGNQHPDVDPLETASYLGINYCEWIDSYGAEEAANRMRREGRRGFYPLQFMGRVIDELKPDVVVTTNSPRSEQAAIEAAVARGIPTLSMVDLFALDYDPYLRRTVHADRITVLGPQVRDKLIASGIPSERIRITGNPVFDALVHRENQRKARLLRESLGWQHRTVVLWAGHLEGGPDTPMEWRDAKFGILIESMLREWVANRSDVALIVRYHPNEYQEFPLQAPQPFVHVSDARTEPVHAVLLAADAVVVQTTTVGVEAAVAGRHVFALSFSPLVCGTGLDYSRLGLAYSVKAPGDLIPMLDAHAGGPRPAAGRFNAGGAARAVAAEIEALMPAGPKTGACRA